MPASLKERLTARVAAPGLLPERRGRRACSRPRSASPSSPRGRKGAPPRSDRGDVLLRMPPAAEGAAGATRLGAQAQPQRADRRDALRSGSGSRLERTRWPPPTTATAASRTTARSASRSSASATAPTRSSRESSTTRTRRTTSSSRASCTSNLGGYHVRDIEFTAAFDVVEGKVGKDLSEAIWAPPERHDQVRRRPRRPGSRSPAA